MTEPATPQPPYPPYKPLVSRRFTADELLNPRRAWVPSHLTDIRATFARIRAEQEARHG